MTTEILPTHVEEFIKQMMPWAHGHQIKAITKFVLAIIDKQTGDQAELARTQGNQEAAAKQLSRLIHNPRLKPRDFAKWLCGYDPRFIEVEKVFRDGPHPDRPFAEIKIGPSLQR